MRYRMIFVLVGPFILWSAWFIMLYAIQGIGCSAKWDTVFVASVPVLRVVLISLFLLAAALSVAMYVMARRVCDGQAAIDRIVRYGTLAGMVSMALVFPGVFWLTLC